MFSSFCFLADSVAAFINDSHFLHLTPLSHLHPPFSATPPFPAGLGDIPRFNDSSACKLSSGIGVDGVAAPLAADCPANSAFSTFCTFCIPGTAGTAGTVVTAGMAGS